MERRKRTEIPSPKNSGNTLQAMQRNWTLESRVSAKKRNFREDKRREDKRYHCPYFVCGRRGAGVSGYPGHGGGRNSARK